VSEGREGREGHEEPEFRGTTRFEVRRRLGAGTFGVVYEALDRELGAVVAVKLLLLRDSDAIYRFKREFRALADIVHPNLVLLYELLSIGDRWVYTMERVAGVPFIDHVRPPRPAADALLREVATAAGPPTPETLTGVSTIRGAPTSRFTGEPEGDVDVAAGGLPPLDPRRLRAALVGIAHGLEALHAAGKLHRDLKPSNVLVTGEGRVVILDFGLVAELDQFETPGQFLGTPAYVSPEQASGGMLTPASDWYCVGGMLYEALTGRYPFIGTVQEVLAVKQVEEPPPPQSYIPDLPADLASLCRDLLRLRPEDRPLGPEVRRRLAGAPGGEGAAETAGPARLPVAAVFGRAGPPPRFVGREVELAALHAAFEATHAGRAVAVRVHGRSGVGKSALLRRFLDDVARREKGALLLAGRCHQRESVPFKALDSVVDALGLQLEALPPTTVEALLPADVPALARLFPILLRVGTVASARRRVPEVPDAMEQRRRAFAAFRELLRRVAARSPLVLAIDDLQWGDEDGARLLHEVLRPPDPPPLLLVALNRSEDEAQAAPIIEALRDLAALADPATTVQELAVADLPPEDARRLAAALLGSAPHAAARAAAIAREAGGNPLFIDELVRHDVEARGEEGEPADLDRVVSVKLDDAIRARVARLADGARGLVDVLAVARGPVDLRAAFTAAALGGEGPAAERILAAAHLARTRTTPAHGTPLAREGAGGDGGSAAPEREEIEPYHDRVVEAVAPTLSPETRRDLHGRLAAALLASGEADPETLAVHFEGAGDRAEAARHAEAAAERAASAFAFDRAARLYRRTLELSGASGEKALDLEARLGESLANARRPSEAASVYLAAAASGAAPERRALELRRRAAELLLWSGDIESGLDALRAVVRAVGLEVPEGRLKTLLTLAWLRTRVRLRGLAFVAREESEVPERDLMRIDTAWSAATGLGAFDPLRGGGLQTRQLLLALEAGEPVRVARALALESVYLAAGGSRSRARADVVGRAATDLAELLENPYARAFATLCAGGVAFCEGRFRDAAEALDRACERLRERCVRVTWELDLAHAYLIASLHSLGEWGEVRRRLPALIEEAHERGDRYALTVLANRGQTCALLAAGEPERARRAVDEADRPGFGQSAHLQRFRALVARVEIALYEGNGARALGLAREGRWLIESSIAARFQVYRIEAAHLRARAALAAAASAAPAAPADPALVRLARRQAHRIEREGAAWAEPLALLVHASVAALGAGTARGEAAALLVEAERRLGDVDLRLLAAAVRRRRGDLAGGAEGARLIAEADALMMDRGVKEPARVAALLVPGRFAP